MDQFSGNEPQPDHRPTAELVHCRFGNGLGLIGATVALADADSPSCVPGVGADTLVGALVAALRIVAVRDCDPGIGSPAPVRETVTLLFTDLVGWTQLASRLSPEGADELRRRHFSTLHRAIGACGGAEVKNLGDGSMVVFSNASTALSCAVAMQRDVDRDNCVSGHPLGLRVGVSGGEVTREGGDYFGDPVIEAARLCARATSGKILAARVVRDMAGRRAPYPYRALGRLELKGLREPLETFEVGWEPGREDRVAWTPTSHHASPLRVASSIQSIETRRDNRIRLT